VFKPSSAKEIHGRRLLPAVGLLLHVSLRLTEGKTETENKRKGRKKEGKRRENGRKAKGTRRENGRENIR